MNAQASLSLDIAEGVPLEKAIARGRRILLIGSDQVDDCKPLATLLRREGHDVRVAGDRREVLSVAAYFSPDVIFLNLCIPEMNGLEVCAILRRSATTKSAAIYALNERPGMHLHDFSGSFAKPFDLKAVIRVIAGSSDTERVCRP